MRGQLDLQPLPSGEDLKKMAENILNGFVHSMFLTVETAGGVNLYSTTEWFLSMYGGMVRGSDSEELRGDEDAEAVGAVATIAELLEEVWRLISETKFFENGGDHVDLIVGLNQAMAEARCGQITGFDSHTALVFSKMVAFDNGVGALLPKFVQAGIPVAVITLDECQEETVRKYNEKMRNELGFTAKTEQIFYGKTFGDIQRAMNNPTVNANIGRFRYLKVKDDKKVDDEDAPNVESFDITAIVKRIIAILGKVVGIEEREQLDKLYEAGRRFKEAA